MRVVFDHAVRRATVETRLSVSPDIEGCNLAHAFHPGAGARCRITWSRDSTSFLLDHTRAPFQPNTKYSFALSPGVTDSDGVVNSLDHSWAITSGPPPVVNGINPSNGSTGFPVDLPLVVTFSNAMNAETSAAITLTPFVPGTRTVRNTRDHGRFVVLPGRLLDSGVTYTLTVGTGATDEHGQHLVSQVTSTFQTGGLGSAGHAIVLARRSGEPATEVLLTALGAQSQGEPAAAAVVLQAPRCLDPPCAGSATTADAPLASYLQAAVSPDGRWVAVVEQDMRTPAAPPSIVLLALPSLVERQIAPAGSDVSWSPDAARLAYGAPDGVHVQTVAAGRDVVLPAGDPLTAPPVWSGDGHVLALPVQHAATGLAHVDLAVPDLLARYPVPGLSTAVAATAPAASASNPALSPDGSVLAVRRDGGPAVDGTWTIRLVGGDATPRRLGSDLTPVAFVDSGTLLAAERPLDSDAGLVRVSVNSGDRDRLASQPLPSDLSSAVVPTSGRQVAYLLPDSHGVRQALIENVDGSNPALLTTFAVSSVEAIAVSFAG